MTLARTVYLVPGMPNALFFISRECCYSEEIDLEEIARPLCVPFVLEQMG